MGSHTNSGTIVEQGVIHIVERGVIHIVEWGVICIAQQGFIYIVLFVIFSNLQIHQVSRNKPLIINMCIAWVLSNIHSPMCYFFLTKKKTTHHKHVRSMGPIC